ncbi:MAG: HlyD family efflux transporter periplasmic adaptor subunit [Eubacteriales bacterium]
MKTLSRVAAILLILVLAAGAACAESLSLNGTIEAGETVPVYAPIGGTVETVTVEQGMRVNAGDAIFSYRTEKTFASEDGKVAGVFVEAGDDAETMTERYGADLYIEGNSVYTISASTQKAYDSKETKIIHTGESVYLMCKKGRYGLGIVTAVDGTSYTVRVTEGDFIMGDVVYVYRDSDYSSKQLIGKGSASRANPTAVNTTGAIVNVAVKDGDEVKRGDLLLETLTGTFEGYRMSGTSVAAEETGVVTSVTAEAGAAVTKGDIVAKIAPISGMRVEALVNTDDRKELKAGDRVTITLESDETRTYEGTVRYISELPEEDSETIQYKVIIDFTPDENAVFGMSVIVTTAE